MVLFEEFSLHIQSLLGVLDDSENLSNRPFRRSDLKRITKLIGILQCLLEHEQRFLVLFPLEVVPTDATVKGPLRLVRSRIRRLFGKIQRFHVPLQCFLGLSDSHHASRVDTMQVHLQHQCKIECFSETWLSLSWFSRQTENSSPLQHISYAHPLIGLRQSLLDTIKGLLSLLEFPLHSFRPCDLCQKLCEIRDVERVYRGWEKLAKLPLSRARMLVVPKNVKVRKLARISLAVCLSHLAP